MRRGTRTNLALGATLIELAVTVAILGVLAAATLPVVNGATDAYAAARDASRATDKLGYAIDRAVRMVREAPEGATQGEVGIAAAEADRIALTDGTELRLVGDTLEWVDGTGSHVLATEIDAFELVYLADDGVTSTAATPELTHCVHVSISSGGLELRSAAFCRVRMVGS